MNIKLNFIYNNNKYLIIENESKIILAKYENNVFIKILDNEKEGLIKILNLLFSSNFDIEKFLQNNIIILNKTEFNTPTPIQNTIVLDINAEKKDALFKNCETLYLMKENNKNNTLIYILPLIVVVLLSSFFYLINYSQLTNNNQQLLDKYTFARDPELEDFYKQEYKIVNVTNKESTNLFNDSFIRFENPYTGYSLSRGMTDEIDGMNMNIYQGYNIPGLVINLVEDLYADKFEDSTFTEFENNYNISIDEVFKRNKINNKLDFMYNIILYSNKNVNSNSSKEEIIDKFTFEFFRPLEIPYSVNSSINKIIFFTGDKYGYANITDENIMIILKNGDGEYRIIFTYEKDQYNNKLTDEQIINIVSTIKF